MIAALVVGSGLEQRVFITGRVHAGLVVVFFSFGVGTNSAIII
jgi:hypothetical protein